MRGSALRRAALAAAALLCLCGPQAADAIEPGEPLAAALHELEREGLRIVYSSAVVGPELRVVDDPGPGTLVERATRLLEPHGLALDPVQPGVFAVVRRGAAPLREEPSPVPASETLQEITVFASRYRLDTQRGLVLAEVTREDIAALPGLDQDAMRVARYLPGTASNGLTARTHVRGGYENEVATYFDGVPLFEPYHFKDFYGPLGILDPGAISRVDFYSGVPPPRYGNRLSGVLEMAPREWEGRNHHEIGVSMLYAHALSQGRLEERPVEWLAAIRRSVVNDLLELADKRSGQPRFTDALARVAVDVGARGEIVAGWLMLDDSLKIDLGDGIEQARATHHDSTAWLHGTWRYAGGAELRGILSYSDRDGSRQGALARPGSVIGALSDDREFDTVTTQVELMIPSDRWRLRLAGEWADYSARYAFARQAAFEPLLAEALGRPPTIEDSADLRVSGDAFAASASLQIMPSERLMLDLGLRWDKQCYGLGFDEDQVSPRVGAQYEIDADTLLRLSWGKLAQAQRPDELQASDGETWFNAPARATQTVLAAERRVSREAVLRLEAFDKRASRVLPAYENVLNPRALLAEIEPDRLGVAPRSSRAYGAELSARWEPQREWASWLAYTWSEATDEFEDSEAERTWNQQHSVVLGVAWTRYPWQLSANGRWNSGWRRNTIDPEFNLSPRNRQSWSDAKSLDLRASWSRDLPVGALSVFAEVINALDHDNLCCTEYAVQDVGGVPTLTGETTTWLPRYALVGVTWTLP
ncbi:MAG: TonB-dependent receptor [Steroidobacteraceae bacterium]|jgi:hypothetical protein|nr:TonB-dependent receptor [Steroidobacteraceae bacterium]